MISTNDQKILAKSSQTANYLVHDIRDIIMLTRSLFTEITIEILRQSIQITQRFNRLESIALQEDKTP